MRQLELNEERQIKQIIWKPAGDNEKKKKAEWVGNVGKPSEGTSEELQIAVLPWCFVSLLLFYKFS